MLSGRRILVVGGDSLIGSALAAAHVKAGDKVSTTSHRINTPAERYLNLAEVPPDWTPPTGTDVAYICAGITSIRYCEEQPDLSARVNVLGTLEVCRALARANVFVVFFSTSLVFDGDRPEPTADSATSPRCTYARQKATVEATLREEGVPSAVLRLTKVIDPAHRLLAAWIDALLQGKTITAFTDMRMSPVTLDTVVAASLAIAHRKYRNVLHLSGPRDIAYFEAARHLAKCLGVSDTLVHAATARESLTSDWALQRHANLAIAPNAPFSSDTPDPLLVIEAYANAVAPASFHT